MSRRTNEQIERDMADFCQRSRCAADSGVIHFGVGFCQRHLEEAFEADDPAEHLRDHARRIFNRNRTEFLNR